MNKALLKNSAEFEFIASLNIAPNKEVLLGIGDDGAIINTLNPIVIAQDMLLEGVHFKTEWSQNFEWIKKAFSANVSDIEAMGTKAKWALLSIGIPPQIDKVALAKAINEELAYWNIELVGGDTISSKQALVQLTLIGDKPDEPILRSNLKVGEKLYLSGVLGQSHIGWKALEKNIGGFEIEKKYHLEGNRAKSKGVEAASLGVKAGLDLSDSLADSLHILARASNVKLRIDHQKVPSLNLSDSNRIQLGLPESWIFEAAEDYVLLVSSQENSRLIQKGWIEIGEVLAGESGVELINKGIISQIAQQGYKHF